MVSTKYLAKVARMVEENKEGRTLVATAEAYYEMKKDISAQMEQDLENAEQMLLRLAKAYNSEFMTTSIKNLKQ
jgi:uncharacterized protein YacL